MDSVFALVHLFSRHGGVGLKAGMRGSVTPPTFEKKYKNHRHGYSDFLLFFAILPTRAIPVLGGGALTNYD